MQSERAHVPQRLVRIYGRVDYEPTNPHSYPRYVQNDQLTACLYFISTLADTAEEHAHRGVFVTHQMSAPHDSSHALRNQFNSSTKDGVETTNDVLDVQVQIEQTSAVDYNPGYGREGYRKTWAIWDKKEGATKGEQFGTEQSKWEADSVTSVAKTTNTV
jgi:hypothetical protein